MAKDNSKGGKAPEWKKNYGLTSAAVFKNERTNSKTGEKFDAIRINVGQAYVDDKGNIQKTDGMNLNQSLRAEHLLHDANSQALVMEAASKRKHGGTFADRERQKAEGRDGEEVTR